MDIAALTSASQQLLERAVEKFSLSTRGAHRIVRVARTIADLAGEENIENKHIAEAINYRQGGFITVTILFFIKYLPNWHYLI